MINKQNRLKKNRHFKYIYKHGETKYSQTLGVVFVKTKKRHQWWCPSNNVTNIVIIPISKVGFGFASGGSEFNTETITQYNKKDKDEQIQYKLPFGGGSGAGVSISPVAFLVIQSNNVKLLPVNHSSAIDRLLDYVPDLIEKTNNMLNKQMNEKKEERKSEEKRKERERSQQRLEDNTTTIVNTAKVQPRKAKMPKYEFEYEETIDDFDESIDE